MTKIHAEDALLAITWDMLSASKPVADVALYSRVQTDGRPHTPKCRRTSPRVCSSESPFKKAPQPRAADLLVNTERQYNNRQTKRAVYGKSAETDALHRRFKNASEVLRNLSMS